MSKVLKDFSTNSYSDSELIIKAGSIRECMTDNSSFPDPSPTLDQLKEGTDNFNAALIKAESGTKADKAAKNQIRDTLEALLQLLADYVQRTSKGDETIILSSGFDVQKKSSTIGPLDKPTGVTVKMGNNKGSAIVMCEVVPKSRYYEGEYTATPVTAASIWLRNTSTKRKIQFNNLKSGTEYAFRITAAGTDPTRNWSDEIITYVI
jgi:hypothetical protein